MDAPYAAAYPELYARHWWWRAREHILLRKIRRLLRDVPQARILDVGCGAALFFDALERFGHVEGVESDRAAVDRSGRWRDRIAVGDLDRGFVPRAPFDLILMLDVLEHITAPEEVVIRAGQILQPHGRILITVPAFTWLWTAHDELNQHVTRYSAAAMRRLVAKCGLVTIESGYLFQSLVVPKLLVRAKEAVSASRPHVPGIPPPPINAIMQAWFRMEHAVAGWLPFGASTFVVAALPARTGAPRPPGA